jgi:hypothetical protein
MSFAELRRRLRNQTLHRRLSKWEISLKNHPNTRNATNKIPRRIGNTRTRFMKKHIQFSIDKLRDRKQIILELIHKSDNIQGEVIIYLDDVSTKHLTLLVIPKSHRLLVWQGSEARKPFFVSVHVSWATRIHEPHVLQASINHIGVRDVSWRLSHEANTGEVALLALDLLILLWARGVITGDVEVTQGSKRSGHDLLELLLLVPEVVLLLVIALVAGVISLGVVVLIGGVKLLPLGAVSDEVGSVATHEATPRRSSPLLV